MMEDGFAFEILDVETAESMFTENNIEIFEIHGNVESLIKDKDTIQKATDNGGLVGIEKAKYTNAYSATRKTNDRQ